MDEQAVDVVAVERVSGVDQPGLDQVQLLQQGLVRGAAVRQELLHRARPDQVAGELQLGALLVRLSPALS